MSSVNDWAAKVARRIHDEYTERYSEKRVERITDIVQEAVEGYLIQHVDDTDVPNDEGNGDALAYNLVQLLRHGKAYRHYCYAPDQDALIASWRAHGQRQ